MDFSRFNPADPFGLVAKRAAGVNIDRVHGTSVTKPHIYRRMGCWWCVPAKGMPPAEGASGATPAQAYRRFRGF